VGNKPSWTAKSRISISASQNSAVETPASEITVNARSSHERGLIAEIVPMMIAVGMAIRAVASARWSVAGTRLIAIGNAGTRCQSESPKSPRTQPAAVRMNWM
jgi:hypothetical protein